MCKKSGALRMWDGTEACYMEFGKKLPFDFCLTPKVSSNKSINEKKIITHQ